MLPSQEAANVDQTPPARKRWPGRPVSTVPPSKDERCDDHGPMTADGSLPAALASSDSLARYEFVIRPSLDRPLCWFDGIIARISRSRAAIHKDSGVINANSGARNESCMAAAEEADGRPQVIYWKGLQTSPRSLEFSSNAAAASTPAA
jgi:hypothetical protein